VTFSLKEEQTMIDDVHTQNAPSDRRQEARALVAEDVAAAFSAMAAGGFGRAAVSRARNEFVSQRGDADTQADSLRLLYTGVAACVIPELERMREGVDSLRGRGDVGSRTPRLAASIEEARRSVDLALAATRVAGDPLLVMAEFLANARRAVETAAAVCSDDEIVRPVRPAHTE
jgi:hypothetical protein